MTHPAWPQGIQQFVPVQSQHPAPQGQTLPQQTLQQGQANAAASHNSKQISIGSATHNNDTKTGLNSAPTSTTNQSVALENVYFNAANYVINTYDVAWTDQAAARDAVRMERRLELAHNYSTSVQNRSAVRTDRSNTTNVLLYLPLEYVLHATKEKIK